MAIARFKELCLDTCETDGRLGRFWTSATGCEYSRTDQADDPGDVVGAEEGMGIALCLVPEPKTVKHRVHLDVYAPDVQSLLDLGARVLREPDDEIGWTVLADPEDGEFCAFVREPDQIPAYRVYELNVDSLDPEAIAGWWAEVFGVQVGSSPEKSPEKPLDDPQDKPWCWIEDVPGLAMPSWIFASVPEPKTVKNRLHWDVYGDVADFESRGATRLWETPRWTVLADPEGNEFCVFPNEEATR